MRQNLNTVAAVRAYRPTAEVDFGVVAGGIGTWNCDALTQAVEQVETNAGQFDDWNE